MNPTDQWTAKKSDLALARNKSARLRNRVKILNHRLRRARLEVRYLTLLNQSERELRRRLEFQISTAADSVREVNFRAREFRHFTRTFTHS